MAIRKLFISTIIKDFMDIQKRSLSSSEAKKRLNKYGLNEIKDIGKLSSLKIFLRQIRSNFLVYFLFFAMILSFFIGKSITGYVLFIVIIAVCKNKLR